MSPLHDEGTPFSASIVPSCWMQWILPSFTTPTRPPGTSKQELANPQSPSERTRNSGCTSQTFPVDGAIPQLVTAATVSPCMLAATAFPKPSATLMVRPKSCAAHTYNASLPKSRSLGPGALSTLMVVKRFSTWARSASSCARCAARFGSIGLDPGCDLWGTTCLAAVAAACCASLGLPPWARTAVWAASAAISAAWSCEAPADT